ncbi:PREDICTED: TSL-kinase interacting protein 1 isoform X2 [Tarenaya hassleriana]|uniref:TSL-kinase interacting protein 1 isoform X2 n=1 Tax=Tarenaya hassleriana TaxID=28532 RepID=UPI00053C95B7|nr:PREDICTED: TSL-kinase interacting protein 1 isoform X2 [Tarenaya hassleriana]
MQVEPQVLLNAASPLDQGPLLNQDGNPSFAASTATNVVQLPGAKKPTRQWAAWTHQEEESFFTALRQVGKNFEKITSRVQSKNKDQVRHYYYRLVRRMNKLLGPELSLDAKNPKDTNAAMLRWWSLLEKYSCKASKLHLKPRRFKLFIESLEHQLLKDRKKSIRKRVCQGENFSAASLGSFSNQSRERGVDNRSLKLILVDSQNIQKLGPGRASIIHSESLGISHGDEKEDIAASRGGRQRRKQGLSSSPAYRRWEKAAINGVSLVADAAEHLERASIDKNIDCRKDSGPSEHQSIGKSLLSLGSSDHNPLNETNMQSATKLKLQLFPIDECTRRALETGKHNPHLELTLSNRKKISSVLEHLNRKWGNSSAASGDLMLFPYSARKETVMSHQRWTQDSFLSAGDVHSMVGSPSVFRLRYGWFIRSAWGSLTSQAPISASCLQVEQDMNVDEVIGHVAESAPLSLHSTAEPSRSLEPSQSVAGPSSEILAHRAESRENLEQISASGPHNEKETGNMSSSDQIDNDDLHVGNDNALSAGEWADSLTNISIGDLLSEAPGDLLSEAPDNIDSDCADPQVEDTECLLQDVPFASDSFDAAIAAHILRHHNEIGASLTLPSGSCLLWDDEETRDTFSFQNNRLANASLSAVASPVGTSKLNAEPSHSVEGLPEPDLPSKSADLEDPMEEAPIEPNTADSPERTTLCGLADVYWPDSLGPLDLDIRSSKYSNEDLILSDSLGGLSRLIASSLDAFQNCSIFGSENKSKDQPSMV